MTPADRLFSMFDKGMAQIPNPPDPMDAALKKAQLERANQLIEADKQRQANTMFDVKMGLFEKFGGQLPDKGLGLVNEALQDVGAGFSVTPDMIDRAPAYLKQVAEYIGQGRMDAANTTIELGVKNNVFRSTQDQQEAIRLQAVAREQQVVQAAEAVMPMPDYLREAQDRLALYKNGTLEDRKYIPGYGTTEQSQHEAFLRDALTVEQGESFKREQTRLRQIFMLDASQMHKALDGSLKLAMDPKARALDRVATLSRKEPSMLTPEERRELESSVFTYGDDSMRNMFQVKSARTEAVLLNKQLADVQNRREMFGQAFATQGQAQADAGEITAGFQAYESGLGANPTVEEVTGARVQLDGLNTRLNGAEQAYRQATMGPAQFLEQEATKSKNSAMDLRIQAQSAAPGTRNLLLEQADEADAVAKSSQAGHRLLTDLNPYALSKIQANIAILTSEVADRKAHDADLEGVDKQLEAAQALLIQKQQERDQAQAVVQAEHLRLLQREKVTSAKMTDAERKAQKEVQLNGATHAAIQLIDQGVSPNKATVQVFKDWKGEVPLEDLRKQVVPLHEGGLVTKAQRAMGAAYEAFTVANKREPTTAELNGLVNNVMRQHPDVKREEITHGLQNRPLVEVNTGEKVIERGMGDRFLKLQDASVEAGSKLARLDRMEHLLTGVETGTLTPTVTQIQGIAASLGVDVPKDLPAKQALEALSNEVALTLRNPSGGAGMPGALSDRDREFLQSMTPGLSKTPAGNRLILDTARKLAKRDQEVAKLAREYKRDHGVFDEGFFEQLQTYADAHPLFQQVDTSQYIEIRQTKDGRRLGKKADGTIEEIR